MNDTQSIEDQLRAENEALRRQLAEQKTHDAPKKPSGWSGIIVFLLIAMLAFAGYYLGYLPREKRERVLAAESQTQTESLPVVKRAATSHANPRFESARATFRTTSGLSSRIGSSSNPMASARRNRRVARGYRSSFSNGGITAVIWIFGISE